MNPIENQRHGKLNLLNTIEKCEKDGLMQFENGKYHTLPEISERIWCVYDRDMEHDDLEMIKKKDDIDFTSAVSLATDSGLQVAWSNKAMEANYDGNTPYHDCNPCTKVHHLVLELIKYQ